MKIKRVYNNSVVMVIDEHDQEMIAVGKGIAYQKKAGDVLDKEKVEKMFTLKDKVAASKLEEIIGDIPSVYISIVDEVVEMIRSESDLTLSDNIYVTLTDHISMSLEREQKGIIFANPLLMEIKQYYKQEYEMACSAKIIIQKYLDLNISDDEVGFIALHIVNASMNQKFEETMKATRIIQDILGIVEEYFQIEMDENSLHYNRFVRHLQFFVRRVLHPDEEQSDDDFLYRLGSDEYPEAYLCTEKITAYLKEKYNISITEAERGYLIYHIRIVSKKARR